MSETKPARPPQVTLAGWLVVGGSVLVVLMAFSEVAALRSLDTRETVEKRVAAAGGDVFGLGVEGVLTAMRVLLMIAAASAAATAILGWHVLRRSRGARVALSLLAGPLFVAGLVQSGGFASAVVTAAIVMLWFQPARDWFDGVTRSPAQAPTWPPAQTPDPSRSAPSPGRDALLDLPPPTGPPLHPTPYAAASAASQTSRAPGRRPAQVTWACVLTWIATVSAFVLFAVVVVAMVAAPDAFLEEAHRQNPDLADQGVSDAALRTASIVGSSVVMAWSAAAGAFALLAWRRVRWAAIALLVSAVLVAGLCLLTVVSSLMLLVPLAACAVTAALLLRPEARAWLRR